MEQKFDLVPLLEFISPSALDYNDWISVGMALKHEGYGIDIWDSWSQPDSRYNAREMESKWDSLGRNSAAPVTGAFITMKAKENGWQPHSYSGDGMATFGWDDEISYERDYKIVDNSWVEGKEIREPDDNWNPVEQLKTYIETLFKNDDYIGYVVNSWQRDDGKYSVSGSGVYGKTAEEILNDLNKYKDAKDLGWVVGDSNPEAGAWIRFNPLDGKGVKNENVTDFKYALVESDNLSIEKQNAIMRELELPIATLVYSGSKSIHAIVKVDAQNYSEYQKRVEYLYKICNKNGLQVDGQNKNPSRLSRMPGIVRGEHKQFLIDTHIGKTSWEEWETWIEDLNDDLPEFESLEEMFKEDPALAPVLIDGVLRRGHKMLIAGPSKAGKSFALMEMCIAIAEGIPWFGFNCERGKVLYINMELDRPSAYKRFKDIYQGMNVPPNHLKNISIWNMRGHSIPMDKLTPKLIRRAQKEKFDAVIIDPIYKVLTGSENDAEQMAKFTNNFDKVAAELGTSVIYCHHHSKGAQGGKSSMDRSSGSGVFARDPDAILDLIELEVTDSLRKQQDARAVANFYAAKIRDEKPEYLNEIGQDDFLSAPEMRKHLALAFGDERAREIAGFELEQVQRVVKLMTAWRLEGTLREFPKFEPVNLWFNYPLHYSDDSGVLKDLEPVGANDNKWSKGGKKSADVRSSAEKKAERIKKNTEKLHTAFESLDMEGTGKIRIGEIVTYFEDKVTRNTIKNWIKEQETLAIDDKGWITKLENNE
ncbi:MAG: AAA family ATPase [Lactococcus cremoris]|uniref:AAA family ATPase n=1 Tax=Lactococcus lactis TaxID=1358 RepID=UPI00071E0AC3|nr:AAA family ATPase [Lactococcus lactis]MRM56157.1 AAA family ATPase [Lactococcus cremoris]ARE01369.1 phage replicative helicase [Lactococcus lactis subsp. lactis]KSU29569.1 Phage replicative DNA helicase repA [Lactococcus lactis subsp. lactis]MCT0035526.1 DNA primase [Lactococcus lactis subsp. lactis]MCT3110314.1 DNA primase [Lactococcus lactis]